MPYVGSLAVLANPCLLHVRCRGLGVVRVGAYQGVDGTGDELPADRLENLRLFQDVFGLPATVLAIWRAVRLCGLGSSP